MVFKDILRQRAIKSVSTKALKKLSTSEILVSPILTEKTMKLQESLNKYSFVVHNDSNKNDVRIAVKAVYSIEPLDVNIVSVVYKGRSQKKLVRKAYKKAIITLKKGEKIEIVS